MSEHPENPFWDFSLSIYALEGVAPACLRLQDHYGADVNLLLYCCWAAQFGGYGLNDAAMVSVCDRVSSWKSRVVAPLRGVRRALKEAVEGIDPKAQEALRSQIKRAELEAERLQQDILFASLAIQDKRTGDQAERRAKALSNIGCYFRIQAIDTDAGADADIAIIVDAVFAGAS